MMTSYVTPIMRDGKRVGAVGIDLALRDLEARTKAVKVLDSGYAYVTTDKGLLVSLPAKPAGRARSISGRRRR